MILTVAPGAPAAAASTVTNPTALAATLAVYSVVVVPGTNGGCPVPRQLPKLKLTWEYHQVPPMSRCRIQHWPSLAVNRDRVGGGRRASVLSSHCDGDVGCSVPTSSIVLETALYCRQRPLEHLRRRLRERLRAPISAAVAATVTIGDVVTHSGIVCGRTRDREAGW